MKIKPEASESLTRQELESVYGEISRYNTKTMADGRQWVIHCITGEAFERKYAQPVQDTKGDIMWLKIGEKISPLDEPVLQKWKNPGRAGI